MLELKNKKLMLFSSVILSSFFLSFSLKADVLNNEQKSEIQQLRKTVAV